MSSTTPTRVLLLGGHGKVALHLTPRILQRGWHLTSVVRSADHESDIRAAATSLPSTSSLSASDLSSRLTVLDRSLEALHTPADASRLLADTRPSIVIWAAGAGGKGGAERTHAVDNVAATAAIAASAERDSGVRAFLMISYLASRRAKPAWWSAEEWAAAQDKNEGVLKNYHAAKLAADEALVKAEKARSGGGSQGGFQAICLRPGALSDEKATGKVQLGKTRQGGEVSREDVAEVAVRLLDRGDARGWIDLLGGDEEVGAAVERVVSERVDCREGEAELN